MSCNGKIQFTQTFRPYKAAKYIKGEDSFFQVAKIPELCVYPGDVNPRVRWEEMNPRPMEKRDYKKIRTHGHGDFAKLIKEVKGHLKAPLADKRPVFALNFARIGQVGDALIVEDSKKERLVLTDKGMPEEPASCGLLYLLPKYLFKSQTMLARFHHDLDTRQLQVKPLGFVTDSAIVRLTF